MKEKKPILSIYIATYNRKNILLQSIKNIFEFPSDDFDIWVLDDCSDDGTFEELNKIQDSRLHVLKNDERQGCLIDGAMPNWFLLAEKCDGIFSIHLNDRDILDVKGLGRLICFLKKHQNLKGGICNLQHGEKIYNSEQAFLKLPYIASHPTGIVFNTEAFHKIPNRRLIYSKKISYIHPHDLILGKLCEMGSLFSFEKIWRLAGQQSFKENRSFLYLKGNSKTSWFAPAERLKEYKLFLDAISIANFSKNIKKKKVWNISWHYLYYCTLNYAYFMGNPGQAAHYGIIPKKLSYKEQNIEKKQFISESLKLQKKIGIKISPILYRIYLDICFLVFYLSTPIWYKIKKFIRIK